MTIFPNHLFDRLARRACADDVAMDGPLRSYTSFDLLQETGRMAQALTELGVRPGDRVAVQVEKSAANLILYLATLRAGAVYLPLNTAYTLPELAYFLQDADPALVVCDPAVRQGVATVCAGAVLETMDADGEGSLAGRADAASGAFETVARAADDLAAICYTSGTTGRSKGAMLTHRALATNAEALIDLWRFTPEDVLIHALPLYHVHGLFVATNVALMAGASMILQARFEPKAITEAMARGTVLMGIPTYYRRLLAHAPFNRAAAKGMRLFISGSAPLLETTHAEFEARTGHAILERYGMTETGMNASNPYDGVRRAGTVGFALPGVALRIADPVTGESLAPGQVGVIEVKGPNVCLGYWRNEEKTREAFRADGYFITGDLGVTDAAGYLSIVGRDKDLIITGGLNVYPKEVEALIDAVDGVVESAVIGLPHADFGEAVTAVAVLAKGAGAPSEADILGHLAGRLARFKQPKRILFASELPRNAMGKVQKATLRDAWRGLYD